MAKIILVYGAPCSGKTTYVKKRISSDDMVYDYDELTKALTYSDKHSILIGKTHQYVLDIRTLILKQAKQDKELKTVYVISTYLTDKLKKLLESLNPTYVEMDTTREECLKLLAKDDTRVEKEEWAKRINDWYDDKEKEQRRIRLIKALETCG